MGTRAATRARRTPQALDALAPISYSVAAGQLHHVLAAYKRQDGRVGRRLSIQLAAVLWRFLSGHEGCLAHAAGVSSFDLVVTVPSGIGERDESHPLHHIVSEIVAPDTRPPPAAARQVHRSGRTA